MRYIFTAKHGSSDAIGINLFLYSNNRQQIIWRDYIISDAKNDLCDVASKINFLIHDPKAEYFVVASGDMKQAYDNSTLNIYTDRDYSDSILSIAGKSRRGQYLNNTYSLVRDAIRAEKRIA